MGVTLVADGATNLFSTDFVIDTVLEVGDRRVIECCKCLIRDTRCKACLDSKSVGEEAKASLSEEEIIGYHVVQACADCEESCNNGHYWLFHNIAVEAEARHNASGEVITWDKIEEVEDEHAAPIICVDEAPDELICKVCYEVLQDAMRLNCGHVLCKRCVFRCVDMKHQCPLDRRVQTHDSIEVDTESRSRVASLKIHCRYGCKRGNAGWQVDEAGCQETISISSRHLHENVCPFKPPPPL